MADIVQLLSKANTDVVDLRPEYPIQIKVRKVYSGDLVAEQMAALNVIQPELKRLKDKADAKVKKAKKNKADDEGDGVKMLEIMESLKPGQVEDMARYQTATVCAGIIQIDAGDGWQNFKVTADPKLVDKSDPESPTLHIGDLPPNAVPLCFSAIRQLDDPGRAAEAFGEFRGQPQVGAVD